MPMDMLYLFQLVSLMLCMLLAAMLALMACFQPKVYWRYEGARWTTVGALVLLSVHYFLQMHYGLRAQGDDVGAVVNILFYVPAQFMIGFSQLIMVSMMPARRRYWIFATAIYSILIILFLLGVIDCENLHLGNWLYAMLAVFLVGENFMVVYPFRELIRMKKRMDDSTEERTDSYLLYLYSGSFLLQIIALLIPFAILSLRLLYWVGPVLQLAILIYVVSFISMGFYIKPVAETVASAELEEEEEAAQLTETMERVAESVNRWVEQKTYLNSNMTIYRALTEMNLSAVELNEYLRTVLKVDGYRRWITILRINASMQLMKQYPDYTIETIAEMSGFSDRSSFTRAFKAQTGLSPSFWMANKS